MPDEVDGRVEREDERLNETATRIEVAAQAMFEHEVPDGSWEAEKGMLSGPNASYSAAPHYRHLAEVALASQRPLSAVSELVERIGAVQEAVEEFSRTLAQADHGSSWDAARAGYFVVRQLANEATETALDLARFPTEGER